MVSYSKNEIDRLTLDIRNGVYLPKCDKIFMGLCDRCVQGENKVFIWSLAWTTNEQNIVKFVSMQAKNY